VRKVRVFVDGPLQVGETVTLNAATSHYVTRVLRLGVNDALSVINDSDFEYLSVLKVPQHAAAQVEVLDCTAGLSESNLRITLEQALLRSEKMSYVLQKSCELGVAQIVPVLTERTEVRLNDEREEKRLKHWREVLISTIEQCGRTRLPVLSAPVKVVELKPISATGLLLDPSAELRFSEVALPASEVRVAIGPEGGFTDAECSRLERLGYTRVKFGPRTLRTETAGPAVIAALQARAGDC